MGRVRFAVYGGIVTLLCAALTVGCYLSGWYRARAAATSIALGQELPTLGPADPEYRRRLQFPTSDELLVHMVVDDLTPEMSTALSFKMILENSRDASIPLVPVGVEVELTIRGWQVVGYGYGG